MNSCYLKLLFVSVVLQSVAAVVKIHKVVNRVPREKDIGLIFDVTVFNAVDDKKEVFEYSIYSDGSCCIKINEKDTMANASYVVGGYFGTLRPGSYDTVSLIWPTLSLFNRVGFCPIKLITKNADNQKSTLRHILHFDTRFTQLDPQGHTFRKQKNYKDCNNWDKEYLKNCTPVNCQDRYFGIRSFYNETSEHCDEVPRCKPHEIYDGFYNECVDPKAFFTPEDAKLIREGKYKCEDPSMCEGEVSDEPPKPPKQEKRRKSVPKDLEDDYVEDVEEEEIEADEEEDEPEEADEEEEEDEDDESEESAKLRRQSSLPPNEFEQLDKAILDHNQFCPHEASSWLKGLADGILIVFATLVVYLVICFFIYLVVSCIMRRQLKSSVSNRHVTIGPALGSEESMQVITRPSLLSQR